MARKLAHLYNEEARVALQNGEQAEELLQKAQHWMAAPRELKSTTESFKM